MLLMILKAFVVRVKTDASGESLVHHASINTTLYQQTPNYIYNYSVDCDNDGINEAINLDDSYICRYDKAGIYDVAIRGDYPSRDIASS